jgi:hypothetical protein
MPMVSKASIAAAVAAVFSGAGFLAPAAAGEYVKCFGVNSCEGRGACKSAYNGCSGENACKGRGYLNMTAAKCKAKGGTVRK